MRDPIILKYIASSGNEYNLKTRELRTRTANYHTWRYVAQGTQLKYGMRVSSFTKDAAVYATELVLEGSVEERAALLDRLHTDFELDIYRMTPGRITWGDWYIDCFIRMSDTHPDEKDWWTDNAIEIFCPRPFWIRERVELFEPVEPTTSEFLEFPFDFEYDYYIGDPGIKIISRDFPFSSQFRLTIDGAVENPFVIINNHRYEIFDNIGEGEVVVIDSRENTITKYLYAGQTLNIFDKRNKEVSIFEPIPGGDLTVTWNAKFAFQLLLYEERSEPTW